MDDKIVVKYIENKLPPIPEKLVDKAKILAKTLNSPEIMLGDKLEAVYIYLDEFKGYIGKHASCAKGCSYCCNIDVQITTLEAEYIHLKTGVPLKHGKNITTDNTGRCPFLSNEGSCNIYKFRPIVCRFLFAFGKPENCMPGKMQIQYGVPSGNFGNQIFKDLIMWLHTQVIHERGEMRDIRDYFSRKINS